MTQAGFQEGYKIGSRRFKPENKAVYSKEVIAKNRKETAPFFRVKCT